MLKLTFFGRGGSGRGRQRCMSPAAECEATTMITTPTLTMSRLVTVAAGHGLGIVPRPPPRSTASPTPAGGDKSKHTATPLTATLRPQSPGTTARWRVPLPTWETSVGADGRVRGGRPLALSWGRRRRPQALALRTPKVAYVGDNRWRSRGGGADATCVRDDHRRSRWEGANGRTGLRRGR